MMELGKRTLMRGIRLGLMACVGVCVPLAQAETDASYNGVKFSTSTTEILPGEWNRNFKQVKAQAQAEHVPMVIFWGNDGCGYCELLEKQFAKASISEQLAALGVYLVFAVQGDAKAGTQASAAKAASKDGSGEFPYVGFYWLKEDGKTVTHKTHGRNGAMPAKGGSLGEQFVNTVKKWIGDWSPVSGGQFFDEKVAPEGEGNRYEAEAGTQEVLMRITRTESAARKEAQQYLTVANAAGKTLARETISWEVDDSVQEVSVDVSSLQKAGDRLTVSLSDAAGKVSQTAGITFIDKPNSAANPLWIGERQAPGAKNSSAPTLAFGEWTADLDAAQALAASEGGFVMVSVQGSLWCPDCANTDRNFLDQEGTADADGEKNLVKQWAKKNRVALVSMDIPKFNSHGGADGPVTTFANTEAKVPTILSREGAETTLARKNETDSGAPESLQSPVFRSGLGYLSRKGVTDEEAAKALERNWKFVSTDIVEGGFHEKTDTWLNRTGVPIFVLMTADGRVVARFTEFANKSPMVADRANVGAYLRRFDEMLQTAVDDPSEIMNNAVAKAAAVPLVANGGEANGCLSAADVQDVFLLKGMGGNLRQSVTVNGVGTAQVTVYLVKADGFKKESVSDTARKYVLDPVAYQSGKLKDGITVTAEAKETGDYFVVVKGDWKSRAASAESTLEPFTIRAEIAALLPTETAATATAPEGSAKVSMALEHGSSYRLVGLENGGAGLTKKAGTDAVYAYTGATGVQQLTLAEEGGSITYQKWNPGTVGFLPDYVTLPAKKGKTKMDVTVTRKEDAGIDIDFSRQKGASGDVTVRVSLNMEKSTFFYDYAISPEVGEKTMPRFYLNGRADFLSDTNIFTAVWRDGADLESCTGRVSVTIRETEEQRIQSFFGNGCVVLDLAVVSATEAGETVVDKGEFTVNFTENQKPKPGKVGYDGADRPYAKTRTVYARVSDEVKVRLARFEHDENPVWAKVKRSVGSVRISADDELTSDWFDADTLELGWDNHESRVRTLAVTNLPAVGKSVKLSLSSLTKNFSVLSSKKDLTIVSVANDAPAFENESETLTVYRYVTCSNLVGVVRGTASPLSFKKLSGSLPSGLSVGYDAVAGCMVLKGVPKGKTAKSGVSTNVVTYQVIEKRPTAKKGKTTSVAGLTTTLKIVVVDPTVAGTSGTAGVALNAACKTTKTLSSIPFVDTEEYLRAGGKARLLAGVMSLTLPASGKASGKFTYAGGTLSFSAKNWSAMSEEDHALCVRLGCTTKGHKNVYADVEVQPDGTVDVSLTTGSDEYDATVPAACQWNTKNPATDYQGYYTVSLCAPQNLDGSSDDDGYEPSGMGYLALTLNVDKKITSKSAVATGTMKWAGVLPNGVKVSGSSVLQEKGGCAWLPYVYNGKSGDRLYGIAQVVRGAKASLASETPCYKSVTVPVVTDEEEGDPLYEIPTVWEHAQSLSGEDLGWTLAYDVRGSYYDASLTLLPLDCCCESFHGSTNMAFTVSMPGDSDTYGALGPVTPVDVAVGTKSMSIRKGTANPQSVKLTFSPKTGVVTGTFKLPVANGKPLSASYAGVVVVGWGNGGSCSECGEDNKWLSFVNGAWRFTDKVRVSVESRGKTVTKTGKVVRGGAMTVEAGN